MPLKKYGVLKGRPVAVRPGVTSNAHYHVHIVDETVDYRIAINVKSALAPSELEYLIVEGYAHPVLAQLAALPLGFSEVPSKPGGIAVDFIRGNFLDFDRMQKLPFDVPGADNDLNEKIDVHLQRALSDEDALVYAFGERWGPETVKDKIFGFLPGNGIHDIHMNQGNVGQFVGDDGVWQDGAMFINFPGQNQWVAFFFKFQSQARHTDDKTGHTVKTVPQPTQPPTQPPTPPQPPTQPVANDGLVRIVAALVNPTGPAPEHETVTLLNTTPKAINLSGWKLANTQKAKHNLSGQLAAGAALVVQMPQTVPLSNKGGIITLLDPQGLKVDGVSYTQQQADREGWTIVF